MAFRPIRNRIAPIHRRGSSRSPREVMLYKSNPSSRKSKVQGVRIVFGVDVLREARYVIGDRVTVQIDPDAKPACAVIKRVPENFVPAWKLISTDSKDRKEKAGTFTRGYIALTPEAEDLALLFPNGRDVYSAQNVSVRDEGILFDLGEAGTAQTGAAAPSPTPSLIPMG